jgi:hypothetical protein
MDGVVKRVCVCANVFTNLFIIFVKNIIMRKGLL